MSQSYVIGIATTAVLVLPILIPVSFLSGRVSNVFILKAKSSMLIGQPCRIQHWIGMGHCCPLMGIEEGARRYIFSEGC